jgi:ribonuclease HI
MAAPLGMDDSVAAKKFYVVWSGRQTGIFTDWPTAQASVDRFPGAKYQSFPSRAEAEHAYKAGTPVLRRARPRAKQSTAAEMSDDAAQRAAASAKFDLQIYCDGACDPNPGNAGSGMAVYRNGSVFQLWYGLHHPQGTNNTAELNALYHALLMAEQAMQAGQTVEILSDSKYSLSCIDVWASGWEKRGWKKASGEIKNLAIIQTSYTLYNRIKPAVRLTHIRGHAGIEGNELADRMAMLAVQARQVELRLYPEKIDVPTILRMRSG